MRTVRIVDRSSMVERLKGALVLDPRRTAALTVDMHRGHLDPEVATMPCSEEDCRRVIAATERLLACAREAGVPVIHVVLVQRRLPGLGAEGMAVPLWRAWHELCSEEDRWTPGRRSTVQDHNIEGSPGTQIIPSLFREGDYVINNKKRLDCFLGTDLDMLLRALGADTLLICGINTNTCVLNTAFTAFNLNYRVVVVEECVASMYGEDLHVLGLENVKRCLGWALTAEEVEAKLAADAPRATEDQGST